MSKKIGVIGTGKFGTALSNLLAENNDVLLYGRNKKQVNIINQERYFKEQDIHSRITATSNIEEITTNCNLIFPVVPSSNFSEMLDAFSSHLTPSHILIHATKGFHIDKPISTDLHLMKSELYTMSDLILKKTAIKRVGCLSGPNLSLELAKKQMAATVISSHYNEVIKEGQKALNSYRFKVFGSNELKGIELAGILKNYIAIGTGLIAGLGYGDNSKAFLITRGMAEMIYIAKGLNVSSEKPFLGLAGVGDLIATCNSELSRNFRVGVQIAKGKKLENIIHNIGEVAEGLKTLQIIKALEWYGFEASIAKALYDILFEQMPVQQSLENLMSRPVFRDVDYVMN